MPSTVIRYYHYDAGRRELRIGFQSGKRYTYEDVPVEIYESMKAAYSKGEYFNAHIRDRFRYRRGPD